MTGGLPTFVDVGHSFGAPEIVEDNLIHQVDYLHFVFALGLISLSVHLRHE